MQPIYLTVPFPMRLLELESTFSKTIRTFTAAADDDVGAEMSVMARVEDSARTCRSITANAGRPWLRNSAKDIFYSLLSFLASHEINH